MAGRPEPMLTYDDYVHFPEGQRWELLEGEAYVAPAPRTRHQQIADRLLVVISVHLNSFGGGRVISAPFDVVLTDTDVVQPDLVFMSDADLGGLNEDNYRGAPTWLVEVLSDAVRDRELKRRIYERAGVGEYWVVDPDTDTIEVYRLDINRYGSPEVHTSPSTISTVALPDLLIDLSELFAR